MYKPHTIEQYKVWQFLNQNFVMDQFLLAPISRNALMVEDKTGDRLVFEYRNGEIREFPEPTQASPAVVKSFVEAFHNDPHHPVLHTFDEVTCWWLTHANPLSHQQAVALPDDLYRHCLGHKVYDTEDVRRIVLRGVVSEEEYLGIRLWYWNGNMADNWLGPLGLDGTGNLYGVTFRYGKPNKKEYVFYLQDDYYRCMNRIGTRKDLCRI